MNKLEKCIKEHVLKNADNYGKLISLNAYKLDLGLRDKFLKKCSVDLILPYKYGNMDQVANNILNCFELYREEPLYSRVESLNKELVKSYPSLKKDYDEFNEGFYKLRFAFFVEMLRMFHDLVIKFENKKSIDKVELLDRAKSIRNKIESVDGIIEFYKDELPTKGTVKLEKEDVSWLELELVLPSEVYEIEGILQIYSGIILGSIVEEQECCIDGEKYKYLKLFLIREKSYELCDDINMFILSSKEVESISEKMELLFNLEYSKIIVCDYLYYTTLGGKKCYIHTSDLILGVTENKDVYLIEDLYLQMKLLYVSYINLLERI